MVVANRVPRYDKNQIITVNNKEITLIQHISDLRKEKNLTKAEVSSRVRQNTSWYPQIERSGKKGDDNRQKTIYRDDLVNIISVVRFGATNSVELAEYKNRSELYLDKDLQAVPLKESSKRLEWYQVKQHRTSDVQDNLFSSLSSSITKHLEDAYHNLATEYDKDKFLDALKEMNASMKIDPLFIVFLAGLPIAEFLYEADDHNIYSLIEDLNQAIDSYPIENCDDHILYFDQLRDIIQKHTATSVRLRRQPYLPLPDNSVDEDCF